MPHSARNGAFDATAVFPAIAAATNSRAVVHRRHARTSCPPAPPPAPASAAMRSSIGTSGMRRRTGGRVGHRLPRAAAQRRAHSMQDVVARHQRAPPHLAEAAAAEAAAGRARSASASADRRSSAPARAGSSPSLPARSMPPSCPPARKCAGASSARRTRGTPASPAGSALPASRSSSRPSAVPAAPSGYRS